jgi:3-hydroxyisobutyrate dehydrogenase-like beta-hydroxyacid dehydrogenase
MEKIRAGFIGLGDMGGPMAQCIIDAGFPLTLWARRESSLEPYDRAKFTRAATPAELGSRSDVVGICVFRDDDVRSVLLGEDGVLAGMQPGGVVMIHATVTVAVCEEIAAAAAERGVELLDAPVSGARAGAEAGTLTVMVGGTAAAMDRAMPVIQSFGKVIRLMGPLGSGQRMKALNNVTGFCNGRIASIAVETGAALGLDPEAVLQILRSGGAASFSIESIATRLLPDPDFRAHAATMMEKDTRLFQSYARQAGLPHSILETLADQRIRQIVPEL